MKLLLIRLLAKLMANLKDKDFDQVVAWIKEQAEDYAHLIGEEKMANVIRRLEKMLGPGTVASFILRLIVQLAYTYAKIKGIIL